MSEPAAGDQATGAAPRPVLFALGDSITAGRGDPIRGVPCRSWARWLADSLDLRTVNVARDGATTDEVIGQLAELDHRAEVAAVYAGVNDVRSPAFDLEAFTEQFDLLLAGVSPLAERVVTCTIPLDLGRPRAGAKVGGANDEIRRLAGRHGALVAELADLRGLRLLLPDAVHPTALGQLEIADRAARALGVPRTPSSGVRAARSPLAVASYGLNGLAPALARDWRRRATERLRRARGR